MNLKSIKDTNSLVIFKNNELVDTEEKAKELLKLLIDKENDLDTLLEMLQTYIEDNGQFYYTNDDMDIASMEL